MSSANRTAMWGSSLDTAWHDARLAVRSLRRSPTLATTIVITLALGIGANAAIFSVVNSLLLRPLPIADPDRLMTISFDSAIARGNTAGFGWSLAMWENLQPHASLFDGALAWTPAQFDLAEGGERQLIEGVFTSPRYFEVLGVPAVRGRTFTAEDDRPGGGADGPVAVISYGLWQRRFSGAEVIGAPLAVDGVTVTIVGVTPPGFFGVDVGRAFDIALPLQAEPLFARTRGATRTSRLLVMLRLKRDQSVEAGTAVLRAIQPHILGVAADRMSSVTPAHNREPFTLVPAATGTSLPVRGPSGLRQTYERPLLTILAVVLLVLLIACVNLANLLVARASVRRYELGVQLALGARRGRLVRQLLIESLVLAILGAIGALLIAAWGSQALVAQLSTPANRIMMDLSLDWRVLAFTATTAVATAAIFGTVPAFRATQMDPIDVLRMQGGRRLHDARSTRPLVTLSSSLVITQIALSLALLVAAALLVRSFARLSHVPLGFDADRVLVVSVNTERARTSSADRLRLFQRIVDAAAEAPGVARAGASVWTPLDGGMRMGDSQSRVAFNFVTPGWFAAYGTAVRLGRDFTVRDTIGAAPVVIVNEAFVHAIMQDQFPLGETIPYPRSRRGEVRRTIVGVVDDAIFDSQREGTQAIVYLPVAQSEAIGPGGVTEISIGVRPAAGTPMQLARSVGAAISGVDPNLSFSFRPLTDHVQSSRRQERIVAMLSGFFGTLSLLIAALGLYGMTSYAASQRFREIAIRMALGARQRNVVRLVLQQIATPTIAGIVLGLAGAAVVTRYLGGLLFNVTPLDPSTFIGVGVLFVVVAVFAASIPVIRATKVEPLVALRTE
jgi:putative ABC transport system permease protein